MNMLTEYRKHLESRLRKAKSTRNNLTRMVEEAIIEINKRAESDKNSVSELFTHLISQQEDEILSLRDELGIGKKSIDDLTVEGITEAVKTLDDAPVPPKETLKFGSVRPGIKKKGGKDVQPGI